MTPTSRTPKLLLTVGPPASGKSTFARQWVAEDPFNRVRINRDDTRTFLGLKHGENESFVTHVQQAAVRSALKQRTDVVVDDTNLVAKFAKEWLKIAQEFGAEVVWHEEFLKVDVRDCILWDQGNLRQSRGETVGKDVIMRMYERSRHWKRPTLSEGPDLSGFKPYTGTPGADPTVLVDIDGTVALNGPDRDHPARGWYDWDKVGYDLPNEPVIAVVQALSNDGYNILFVSGRTDEGRCRELTEKWLRAHVGIDAPLIMRETNCGRKDSIVKLELFDKYIRDNYDVKFCIDDRDQVVRAYRDVLGLTVLQCAPGDF